MLLKRYNEDMVLENNVRQKPRWWKIVPFLSGFTAHAIYPNIYLPETIYENLKLDNPKPKWIALLKHEQEHLKRETEIGPLVFGLKYLFSPSFRFREEMIAIKAQMKYLKSVGEVFDTERGAKFLSGWLYLWPVSYATAKRALDEILGQ